MQGRSRRRVAGGAGTACFAAIALLAGPGASSAVDADDAANALQRASTRQAEADVDGKNPHGQGTVLSASIGGKEAVVVGRSRGEQRSDGTYHGKVTTLAVYGNDVVANETGPGETSAGPIDPIQKGLLDSVCAGTGGNACVEALRADSSTTSTGSTNHSKIAGAGIGGDGGVKATAAESNGNIQQNGDCQTAHGDVTIAQLILGGTSVLNVGQSASDSEACPDGTTVTNSGDPLVVVGGNGLPLPGCGANDPGTLLNLSPLLTVACNAGSAAGAGAANTGLVITALGDAAGDAVLTTTGAGTTAAAQPPAGLVAGTRQGNDDDAGEPSDTRAGAGPDDEPRDRSSRRDDNTVPAQATVARPLEANAKELAFTGANLLLSLFLAAALIAAGLLLRRFETGEDSR